VIISRQVRNMKICFLPTKQTMGLEYNKQKCLDTPHYFISVIISYDLVVVDITQSRKTIDLSTR
jgi:hypothetical protein